MKTAQELVDEFFDTIRRDYTSDVFEEVEDLLKDRLDIAEVDFLELSQELDDTHDRVEELEKLLTEHSIPH